MKRAWGRALCVVLGLAVGVASLPSPVSAQDTGKPARAHRGHGKSARRSAARAPAENAGAARHGRPARAKSVKAQARADKKKRLEAEKAGTASAGHEGRAPDSPPAKSEAGPSAAAQAAQAAASGVNAQIVKEGDTSVKVMEFTGLGIEGRLKSPQLVYFVQRVRAEFERPLLPHRSFMPELEASTGREPVR